jgi:hypothetical protein
MLSGLASVAETDSKAAADDEACNQGNRSSQLCSLWRKLEATTLTKSNQN